MKYALPLVLLFAIPALADSVPIPPVTSVSFSGVTSGGFFNSPTDYDLGGSNSSQNHFCTSDCVEFQVQNGVITGRSTINFASIYGFTNGSGGAGGMFGHLGRVSFNAQTDVLSGFFGGKEQMSALVRGEWYPEYWYTVQGTFSENLSTGVGSVNLNHEQFIGTTPVPEPSTWLLLATGLSAFLVSPKRWLSGRLSAHRAP